jgi:hypothetical protein
MPIFFHLPTTTDIIGESLPPFVPEFPTPDVIQVPHGCLPVLGYFHEDEFFCLVDGKKTEISRGMFSGPKFEDYESIFFMCPFEYLRAMGVEIRLEEGCVWNLDTLRFDIVPRPEDTSVWNPILLMWVTGCSTCSKALLRTNGENLFDYITDEDIFRIFPDCFCDCEVCPKCGIFNPSRTDATSYSHAHFHGDCTKD